MINSALNGTIYYVKIISAGAFGGYLRNKLQYGRLRSARTDIISGAIIGYWLHGIGRFILETKFAESISLDKTSYIVTETIFIETSTSFILGIFAISAFDIIADCIDSYVSDWRKKRNSRS